jgi:hypothetical protein
MIRKLKYLIAGSLVFIFMAPMMIKLLDSQFHHHDHFIFTAKNEQLFHEYHDKCPIPGFEYFLYTINKAVIETEKTSFFTELFIDYISVHFCNNSEYSFSLRAPPLNIHY